MTDTPRTEAGRRLLARESYNSRSFALITVEDILAIEAEAAAGPRDTYDEDANEAARQRAMKAAAGPRDEHEDEYDALARQMHESIAAGQSVALTAKALRLFVPAEAAAGPRDVPVLPPPDPSLIDTLGEGADPDRPVRVKASE